MSDPSPEELIKRYRLVLVLCKCRVTERSSNQIKIAMGGSTTITVTDAKLLRSDVRAGDILTVYTEIPYANPGGYA